MWAPTYCSVQTEPLRAESALRSEAARALALCALASMVRRGVEAAQHALGGRLVRARGLPPELACGLAEPEASGRCPSDVSVGSMF